MKRVILFFFLFLGLLQVSFAQNDKLVPLSVYPSVKNVASLIRSMNKKLLPFKGRVTSKSLIDLLGYIDSGSTYDSDESEADKAKNSPTDDAIFYVSETNKSAVLSLLNIDSYGLDSTDRQMLTAMIEKFSGGPVGIDTIAVAIGEDNATIEDVYEPYLIQSGFLIRTQRGRMVTDLAYEHLGLVKNDAGK